MLNSTDVALAVAVRNETFRMVECESRYFPGETYIALEDDKGVIEVALDWQEAFDRYNSICERVA